MRELWIHRVNAAARLNGVSYSQFIAGLKRNNIAIDRKILADLAMNEPESFKKLIDSVK